MQTAELTEGYSIPRVINGCWQLSAGHSGAFDAAVAQRDMEAHIDAGLHAFDCGDIYTGVEEFLGDLVAANRDKKVLIHTKYVPDLDVLHDVDFDATRHIVERSLMRLRVERLDLVQFHWWDFGVARYVEVAQHLAELQRQGKIAHIGVTNFDGTHLKQLLDAGVPVVSNQVQYSVLDGRPAREDALQKICAERGVKLLCYGTMAGGFLQEKYLGLPKPETAANRSQTKYGLIIDEFGGWELFQEMLGTLVAIGKKHGIGASVVAGQYILQQPHVASLIVGARNAAHLPDTLSIARPVLDAEDMARIGAICEKARGPKGDVYALERNAAGRHGSIMRYNLNGQRAYMDGRGR